MKERITFIYDAEDTFTPLQLQLENDALYIHALKAAREHRLTFALQELPQELWRVLKECYELNIRWSAPWPYNSTAPFVSRASPGLHVFFTPQRNRQADLLCPLLRKIFGETLNCINPRESFTSVSKTSERFTSSAAYQYFQLFPSLADLSPYVRQKICVRFGEGCFSVADSIDHADYLDMDFDTISQAFTLSIFQHKPLNTELWNDRISNREGQHAVEVGVLASQQPLKAIEEQSLGGFLTTVGEDERPNPTLFSFPARHHPLSRSSKSTYRASLVYPTGLHPILRLSFQSTFVEPYLKGCSLHTYLTLPSILFPDRYQLSEPLFLASKNLRSIRSVSGETDLEAPGWAVTKWGSAMLVELAPPSTNHSGNQALWDAEIPLHIRYLGPNNGGKVEAEVPWPVVFWACVAEEGTKMSVNPFDRLNLGYDGLFGPRTMFYHLNPHVVSGYGNETLLERLEVPVLNLSSSAWVEKGTVMVMVLGLVWVFAKLARAAAWNRSLDRDRGKKSQ